LGRGTIAPPHVQCRRVYYPARVVLAYIALALVGAFEGWDHEDPLISFLHPDGALLLRGPHLGKSYY
jgi:hypothetical protein